MGFLRRHEDIPSLLSRSPQATMKIAIMILFVALIVAYQINATELQPRIPWNYLPTKPLKIPIRLPNLKMFFYYRNLFIGKMTEPAIPNHQQLRGCMRNKVLLSKKKSMIFCLLGVVRKIKPNQNSD